MIKSAFIALIFANAVLPTTSSAQTPIDPGNAGGPPMRAEPLTDLPPLHVGLIETMALTGPTEETPIVLESGVNAVAESGLAFNTEMTLATPWLPGEEPFFDSSLTEVPECDSLLATCGTGVCGTNCDGGCRGGRVSAVSSQWTPWQCLHNSLDLINYERFSIGARFRNSRTCDRGIGYERVMFAPNVLDTAVTAPHVGFRYQLDYGLQTPDRAEYYWGVRENRETGVNSQDLSVRLAIGSQKAMALTQYTMRSLDPEVNENTTGMGDMMVGAIALLKDGKRTKVATIFRTYLATGPKGSGLGTGHTSLEYGLLARHCVRPETYLFGELKYWMPIKGTAGVAGDVLSTGWGISTIAAESDIFAFLPTFEVRTLSFLFGGQNYTSGPTPTQQSIDGVTAIEFYPGARFVLGPETDLGLWEFGFSAGITAADDEWFDTRWVFDLRLSR